MTRGITTDILDGLSSSVAVKGPCAVKTTANVTLAGEQTIDGVTTSESRVLVGSQTDTTQNGIWVTSSGDWRRAADFSRNDDVVSGTFVAVTGGSTGSGLWMASFTGALAIDTTHISFTSLATLVGYITAAAVAAGYQPLDADLTAIAALATATFGRSLLTQASASAARTTLGVAIGSDVQAYDAQTAKLNIQQQTLAGGTNVTVKDLGNLSGNSLTPNPGDRPIQKITNNGAGSILPGSNEGQYSLEVINTTGAGAITTTGWTLKGDSFDTTTTSKFLCSCFVTSDIKTMIITKVA